MKAAFTLMVLLFLGSALPAQLYKEGTLMTTSGDTLDGLVALNKFGQFYFKEEQNGKTRIFEGKEILSYKYEEGRYEMHLVEVKLGRFPERVEDYLLVVEEGPVQLLEYTGKGIFGNEYTNYFLNHADGLPYRIENGKSAFKRTMRLYFEECQPLVDKIKSGEFHYDNIQEMVQFYNNWVANQPAEAPASE